MRTTAGGGPLTTYHLNGRPVTANVTDDANRIVPVDEARALGERALESVGFDADEARIITDHLIDSALCGYDYIGLPRVLTIAEDPRTREGRTPIRVVRETKLSLLLDGGNH